MDCMVSDAGLFVNINHFRTDRDTPPDVVSEAIKSATRPIDGRSANVIMGEPSPPLGPLSADGRTCFGALKGLLGGTNSTIYPVQRYEHPTQIGGRSASMDMMSVGGGITRPVMPPQSSSFSSIFEGSDGPAIAAAQRSINSQFLQRSVPRTPFDAQPYSNSHSQGPYGADPSRMSTSPYSSPPQYQPPTRLERFGILRMARIPPELASQLAYSQQQIEFGSLFPVDDIPRQLYDGEYRRTYNQYISGTNEYGRLYGATPVPMAGGLGDMQISTMYQVVEVEQKKREYLSRIRELDSLNGETTAPEVEGLTLVQLMQLYEMKQNDMNRGMNAWFYGQAITAGGGVIGKVANGKTGNKIVDRYLNMSKFSQNLMKMKSQPWWRYALSGATQNSVLGGRPGLAVVAMLGMTACVSVQEGMDEYDSMEVIRRQELDQARLRQLEKGRNLMITEEGEEDRREGEHIGRAKAQSTPVAPEIPPRDPGDGVQNARSQRRRPMTRPREQEVGPNPAEDAEVRSRISSLLLKGGDTPI